MRYVQVDATGSGYFLDPRPYLARLPELRRDLPAGAEAFATDPGHYDFSATTCVKDLRLSRLTTVDHSDAISVEIRFGPNTFKHDGGLSVRYENVTTLSVTVTAAPLTTDVWPTTRRLGDVQLDEILPHDGGCSHEVMLTGGSILVVAADLRAQWHDTADDEHRGDA